MNIKHLLRQSRAPQDPGDESQKDAAISEQEDTRQLREQIIDALKTVFDPEIPVNIYDLGLIYRVDIDPDGQVEVDMTLTAPACPVAGILPDQVANAIRSVNGVSRVRVNLVWDPPWSKDRMDDTAKLQLGLL